MNAASIPSKCGAALVTGVWTDIKKLQAMQSVIKQEHISQSKQESGRQGGARSNLSVLPPCPVLSLTFLVSPHKRGDLHVLI